MYPTSDQIALYGGKINIFISIFIKETNLKLISSVRNNAMNSEGLGSAGLFQFFVHFAKKRSSWKSLFIVFRKSLIQT